MSLLRKVLLLLLLFVFTKSTRYEGIFAREGYRKISDNNNDNIYELNDDNNNKQKINSNVDELRMLNHENGNNSPIHHVEHKQYDKIGKTYDNKPSNAEASYNPLGNSKIYGKEESSGDITNSYNIMDNAKIHGKPKPVDEDDIPQNDGISDNIQSNIDDDNDMDNDNEQKMGLFGRLLRYFKKRRTDDNNAHERAIIMVDEEDNGDNDNEQKMGLFGRLLKYFKKRRTDDNNAHERAIIMVDEEDNGDNDDDFVDKFLNMLDQNDNYEERDGLNNKVYEHKVNNIHIHSKTPAPSSAPIVLTKENILDQFIRKHDMDTNKVDDNINNDDAEVETELDEDKDKPDKVNSMSNEDINDVDIDTNKNENNGYRHYVQLSYFLLY